MSEESQASGSGAAGGGEQVLARGADGGGGPTPSGRWGRRLHLQVTDPDHQLLHRGLRTALALSALFVFGTFVVKSDPFTTFAAFGAFFVLALAELGGRRDGRPRAYAALAATGAIGIVAGTLASQNVLAGAVAMLVGVFVLQFATVFGGYVAAGEPAVLLIFVLALMIPGPPADLVAREAGWITACAVSTLLALFLWPPPDARLVSGRYAAICRAIADVLHGVIRRSERRDEQGAHAGAFADADRAGDDPGAVTTAAMTAAEVEHLMGAARDWALAQPTRPAGPTEHDQALGILADELSRAVGVLGRVEREAQASPTPIAPAQRTLAAEVAATFAASADALERGVAPSVTPLEIDQARDEHLHALTGWIEHEMATTGDPAPIVATTRRAFPLRVLSLAAVTVSANAAILAGSPVDADPLVTPPRVPGGATATATERRAERILRDHLHPGSVWFRNSARAAVALAAALCVAQLGDFEHAFWIVLGALSVLRSNALGTSRTAMQAIFGNVLGFLVAAAVLAVGGDGTLLLWIVLPFTVFLSAYTPAAVHFVVGQASFCLFVVVLFSVIDPAGIATGLERLENCLIGAAVSVVIALVFWPRGAGAALRTCLAALYRADAGFLAGGVRNVVAPVGEPADVRARLARELSAARRQANNAYATYLNERGRKRVEREDWAALFSVATGLRLAGDSLQQLGDLGFAMRERGEGSRSDASAAVRHAWHQRIDQLDDVADLLAPLPRHGRAGGAATSEPPEERAARGAASAITAADLDGAVARAVAEAHAADDVRPTLGLVFTTVWLETVDHLIDGVRGPAERAHETGTRPWYR